VVCLLRAVRNKISKVQVMHVGYMHTSVLKVCMPYMAAGGAAKSCVSERQWSYGMGVCCECELSLVVAAGELPRASLGACKC